jgi:hypothetical protein
VVCDRDRHDLERRLPPELGERLRTVPITVGGYPPAGSRENAAGARAGVGVRASTAFLHVKVLGDPIRLPDRIDQCDGWQRGAILTFATRC